MDKPEFYSYLSGLNSDLYDKVILVNALTSGRDSDGVNGIDDCPETNLRVIGTSSTTLNTVFLRGNPPLFDIAFDQQIFFQTGNYFLCQS